ncbi:homologous-pairing protein 2 homolog [Nicotiana sylvestris]|uniref:homologous-pairing protein 2 homolog n=1 Tax=Nicotiana sylvestris TaxID=4096 RepID=UPI00388CE06D
MASTREAAKGLCAEGKEGEDYPLVLRGRRSVAASKSTDLKATESEAAGTEAAEAFKLFNQAFSKSQAELARCEDEFRKLVSKLDELKALHLKQKNDLMREDLRVRDTEILGLKLRVNEVSSDKETLREKLTSVECQLQGARKDVAAAIARARKALEDVYAGGINFSVEIERVKALKEESTTLLSPKDGSTSGSTRGSKDNKDKGEVPEGEEAVDDPRVEGQAVEGTTSEGAPSGQVTPR